MRTPPRPSWALAFLLGVAGAVLVSLIYALAAPRFSVVCCSHPLPLPWVDESMAALGIGMIAVVFLVAALAAPLASHRTAGAQPAGEGGIPDAPA